MKKIFTILSIIIFLQITSFSQTTILDEDVLGDTIIPERGQNLKKYSYFYYNIRYYFGETEGFGANIKYGNSFNTSLGYRFKRKLSKFYSIGYDFNYNYSLYSIIQDSSKIFPNPKIHNRENLIYNNFALEIYNRFSFGKRGNFIKYYFDLGAYAEYGFVNYLKQVDKYDLPNENNSTKIKVKNYNLTFIYPYNYGLTARIGYNKFALTARYRLSDLFKNSYSGTFYYYPELPRYSLGLEICFF